MPHFFRFRQTKSTILCFGGFFLASYFATRSEAQMLVSPILEIIAKSDVVLLGKVSAVGADEATVIITGVLVGQVDGPSVSVSPIRASDCTGSFVDFEKDEEVLLFGDAKGTRISLATQGKKHLGPETRSAQIGAAQRFLAIAAMDEDAKNLALLAEVGSPNRWIRSEAQRYVAEKLTESKTGAKYQAALLEMLDRPDPEVQRTALQALRFCKIPQKIPEIVALTKSQDLSVVSAASLALSTYDTVESSEALISLLHHPDPKMVIRASIDLSRSRRFEARAALENLLKNEDPRIRAGAPSRLVSWLRREQADGFLPKLVTLLKDPEVNVRASAASALGESRRTWLVTPLLEALRAEPNVENSTVRILDALYCHYSKDEGTTAQALIDKEIALVVAAVHLGGKNESFGPAFRAIGILDLSKTPEALDALRWAKEFHPSAAIREYAERSLASRA